MPLRSPYPIPPNAATGATVIAHISREDKETLVSFAGRGVITLAVQNLIHNLANDIRALTGQSEPTYVPDSSDILDALLHHRPFGDVAIAILERTSVGRSTTPRSSRRGSVVLDRPREGEGTSGPTPTSPTEPTNPEGTPGRRVRQPRKAGTKKSAKNPGTKTSRGVGQADE